jgi:hypothetical protein
LWPLDALSHQLSQQQLSAVEREVAGLLGAEVYPGKQLAPFADNQPMLITSLLLNASACNLRDPSVCGDPALAPHNALHLAAAAMVLQPSCSKAYHRTACALGKLGGAESLRAAHAIMRHAAQLEGRPAAELLAQLPPLPPGAVELPFGATETSALHTVMCMILSWPRLMRERAPAGQDFLLQLPGGLGELPRALVHASVTVIDTEAQVAAATEAKERGNTAFAAGDIRTALSEYRTGIDSLRVFTATYLSFKAEDLKLDVDAQPPEDPARDIASTRHALQPLVCMQMYPYMGQMPVTTIRESAAILLKGCPPLPVTSRLPGCKDLPALIGTFWSQLVDKFMEPYGGVEGLLANSRAWKHHSPVLEASVRVNFKLSRLFAKVLSGPPPA